jgi:hypothetical protein
VIRIRLEAGFSYSAGRFSTNLCASKQQQRTYGCRLHANRSCYADQERREVQPVLSDTHLIELDPDGLHLCIEFQCMSPGFTTISTHLVTAEGHSGVHDIEAVDPDYA